MSPVILVDQTWGTSEITLYIFLVFISFYLINCNAFQRTPTSPLLLRCLNLTYPCNPHRQDYAPKAYQLYYAHLVSLTAKMQVFIWTRTAVLGYTVQSISLLMCSGSLQILSFAQHQFECAVNFTQNIKETIQSLLAGPVFICDMILISLLQTFVTWYFRSCNMTPLFTWQRISLAQWMWRVIIAVNFPI